MQELSLHLLDVVQNSLDAGATRIEIVIVEDLQSDKLTIRITDNGRGMSPDIVAKVLDPFYTTRTTRRVGLGLPLFAAAAQDCGGDLQVESTAGQGTTVIAIFQHSHIDRAPLGDIKSTLMSIIMSENPCDLHYVHQLNGNLEEHGLAQQRREFDFDTADIKRELACPDAPGISILLSHPAVREWLVDFITEGEESLLKRELICCLKNED